MAEENDTFQLNTRVLDNLVKAFKGKLPVARVGVMGDKNARVNNENGPTNAEIGAKHEFGSGGMPQRSFLRVPICDNFQKYLENSGFFDIDALTNVVAEASLKPWVKKFGAIGVAIVLDGFDSGGFGKWKPSNMQRKEVKQTLVETQQLRNSITFEVK